MQIVIDNYIILKTQNMNLTLYDILIDNKMYFQQLYTQLGLRISYKTPLKHFKTDKLNLYTSILTS